jgi:hypothetical protein
MLIVLRHFLKRIVGINIGDFKDLSILFNLERMAKWSAYACFKSFSIIL